MVRLSLPRRFPYSVPPTPQPVWPPPPPPEHVPFPPLPKAATQAYSFASSSPLNPVPSPSNTSIVVTPEGDAATALSINNQTRAAVLAKRRVGGKFLDYLHLSVRGGIGGNGCIAFVKLAHRRDNRGPPSGGAGGPGGDVYIQADYNVHSLADVMRNVHAGAGGNGMGDSLKGQKGQDVTIKVPHGTRIRQISREVFRPLNEKEQLLDPIERDPLLIKRLLLVHPRATLDPENNPPVTPAQKYNTTIHGTPLPPPPPIDCDLRDMDDQRVLLVRGGLGGEGNQTFGRHDEKGKHLFARKGETPDTVRLELELRLLADIGFLGAPNAGKSTLLQALTGYSPVIAPHAFTTLNPQVGLCRILADGTILSSPSKPSPLQTPESALAFADPVLPTVKVPLDQPLPEKRAQRYYHGSKKALRQDEALRFRICDNPGLIADSHMNKGLGHQFLLSVTRTPTLVLVLDFSLPLRRLIEQAEMLVREVSLFEPEQRLKERIRLVVGNKADLVTDPRRGEKRRAGLERWVRQNLGPKRVRTHASDPSPPELDEDGESIPPDLDENGNPLSPPLNPSPASDEWVGQPVGLKLISGMWGQGIRDLAFSMGELVVQDRAQDKAEREERRQREREEEEEMIRNLQNANRVLRINAPLEQKAFGLKKEFRAVEE